MNMFRFLLGVMMARNVNADSAAALKSGVAAGILEPPAAALLFAKKLADMAAPPPTPVRGKPDTKPLENSPERPSAPDTKPPHDAPDKPKRG
ncbi:MAG TPA: hypothetical protein VGD36_15815 [Xanthobacteraceae bacterium]|jgi:hypothetical protein